MDIDELIDRQAATGCICADALARTAEGVTEKTRALALADIRLKVGKSAKLLGVTDAVMIDFFHLSATVAFWLRLADRGVA